MAQRFTVEVDTRNRAATSAVLISSEGDMAVTMDI